MGTTGIYTQIATVGANVTSYTDTNLTEGAIYCYRVAAFNSAGSSAYTIEGCAAARPTLQQIARIGIFRPSTGEWYLDNGNGAYAFGMSGDVPVPRDYEWGREERCCGIAKWRMVYSSLLGWWVDIHGPGRGAARHTGAT
jgi:hypothetical protein